MCMCICICIYRIASVSLENSPDYYTSPVCLFFPTDSVFSVLLIIFKINSWKRYCLAFVQGALYKAPCAVNQPGHRGCCWAVLQVAGGRSADAWPRGGREEGRHARRPVQCARSPSHRGRGPAGLPCPLPPLMLARLPSPPSHRLAEIASSPSFR